MWKLQLTGSSNNETHEELLLSLLTLTQNIPS